MIVAGRVASSLRSGWALTTTGCGVAAAADVAASLFRTMMGAFG
jgi:hypothetical protein